MSGKGFPHPIADAMRLIARVASVFVIAIALLYIFAASMMISGSGSAVFPKMAFSFAALIGIVAALVLSWRREALGAIITLFAFAGYRLAEWARLGHVQKPTLLTFIIPVVALLCLASASVRRYFARGSKS